MHSFKVNFVYGFIGQHHSGGEILIRCGHPQDSAAIRKKLVALFPRPGMEYGEAGKYAVARDYH